MTRNLKPDVLFVDDGDILTSAGSAAALYLALHIVRLDHGAQVANFVSRRLVFSAFRDSGQRQFIEHPVSAPPRWAGSTPLASMPSRSESSRWADSGSTSCT